MNGSDWIGVKVGGGTQSHGYFYRSDPFLSKCLLVPSLIVGLSSIGRVGRVPLTRSGGQGGTVFDPVRAHRMWVSRSGIKIKKKKIK